MFSLGRRRQSLIDEVSGKSLVLPITPAEYGWKNGVRVSSVTVDGLGDLHLPGYKALDTRSIDCMFPARAYPFNEPETLLNPFEYVYQIETWCQTRTKLRYIVSGTPLNACVIIESLQYGEKDGTNDVYATITLRQYQPLAALPEDKPNTAGTPTQRPADTAAATASTYTVVKGDTLGAIARKFYGNAKLYKQLAAYNGVKNPNLIFPGQVLNIPPLATLTGGAG